MHPGSLLVEPRQRLSCDPVGLLRCCNAVRGLLEFLHACSRFLEHHAEEFGLEAVIYLHLIPKLVPLDRGLNQWLEDAVRSRTDVEQERLLPELAELRLLPQAELGHGIDGSLHIQARCMLPCPWR